MLDILTLEELKTTLKHLDALLEDLAGSLQVCSGPPAERDRNVHWAIRAMRLEIAGTARDTAGTPSPVLKVGTGICSTSMQPADIQRILVEMATKQPEDDFDSETIRQLDRLVALGAALLWLLCEDRPLPGELLRPVWKVMDVCRVSELRAHPSVFKAGYWRL
jgi:hypothetical protein